MVEISVKIEKVCNGFIICYDDNSKVLAKSTMELGRVLVLALEDKVKAVEQEGRV